MKSIRTTLVGTAISVVIVSCHLFAQNDNGNEIISDQQKQVIFGTAIIQLKENYIFPERISKIESVIKRMFDTGKYSSSTTLFDFLEALNKDFESSGNDHHLNIFYGPQYVKKLRVSKKNTSAKSDSIPVEFVNMVKYENFFLKRVERLDGNIGYFKFNKFEELQLSKEPIASAMNFISNSSALIIDLRENGGGSAETVHFLMSYFLPDSTRLGEFKRRLNNEVVELWTTKHPLIRAFPAKVPVYVLVSNKTSSAAESFAYGLQQLKRATIVGEQTHGEGNPGSRFIINDKLYMMIPTAVNVNAITGTNWDGVGVTPDVKTTAGNAYAKAMVEACRVLSATGDNDIYKWMMPEYEAELNPESPSVEFINSIIGKYDEGKKVILDNGSLYYTSETSRRKMIYMSQQTFLVDGRKDYRMRFPTTDTGIEFVEFLWNDGTIDKLKKIN